jgi:hypothetical protein
MAELKTKPNRSSVTAFLATVKEPGRRRDCQALAAIMKKATGAAPKMWGPSIVGFGDYHYKYASGREGDWFVAGFSPRAQALTLYVMPGLDRFGPLLKRLGKYKTGRSCLYIKSLEDVDVRVLEELIAQAVRNLPSLRK